MKSIEQTIREIAAEHFPKFTYVFENWEDADTKLERLEYPAIVCVLPAGGSVGMRNGRIFDTEYIALAFLDKAPRGAEGEDNAEIYTRMKVEGWKFIEQINKTRQFEPILTVPYDTICERLSTVVTGVMFSLTLQQIQGGCIDG